MSIKLTVVYEVKEEKDAEEILQLFKTNEVMEFTEDGVRIIACAQGDAMEQRDVLRGQLEQDGYNVDALLAQ